MRNLSWKFGFALLTFFIGTVLALIWFPLDSKPIETVKAQSRPIEIPMSDDKIPEPPSEVESPVIRTSKSRSSIRRVKNGGEFCEKYLLKKIAKEKSADSQLVRLKNFNPEMKLLRRALKSGLSICGRKTCLRLN